MFDKTLKIVTETVRDSRELVDDPEKMLDLMVHGAQRIHKMYTEQMEDALGDLTKRLTRELRERYKKAGKPKKRPEGDGEEDDGQ